MNNWHIWINFKPINKPTNHLCYNSFKLYKLHVSNCTLHFLTTKVNLIQTLKQSISCTEGMSHVQMVQSIAAVTSHRASGLNVASVNCPLCLWNFLTTVWVSRSMTIMVKSSRAAASIELSWCGRKNDTDSSIFTSFNAPGPFSKIHKHSNQFHTTFIIRKITKIWNPC